MYRVELTICAARKIYDGKSMVNIPDPVVRIRCGDVMLRTTIKRNNTAPEWYETFRFPVEDDKQQVEIELWNHNVYNEELLGKYVYLPAQRIKGVVSDNWYVLTNTKTEAEIRIRALSVGLGVPPTKPQMWMVTDDILKDPVEQLALEGKTDPDPEVVAACAADKEDLQKDSDVTPIPISYITYAQAPEPGVAYTPAPKPVFLVPQKGCYQVPNAHITAAQAAEPDLVYSPQAVQISGGIYIGHPPIPSIGYPWGIGLQPEWCWNSFGGFHFYPQLEKKKMFVSSNAWSSCEAAMQRVMLFFVVLVLLLFFLSFRILIRDVNMPTVFRSASALKLVELDDRFRIFSAHARTVLDLAAAPGGFSQVALERMHLLHQQNGGLQPMVVAVDQRRLHPLPGLQSIRADIKSTDSLYRSIFAALEVPSEFSSSASRRAIDVVLHDGVSVAAGQEAFSVSYAQNQLVLQMLRLSCELFAARGPVSYGVHYPKRKQPAVCGRVAPVPVVFVTKVFHSPHQPLLQEALGTFFSHVQLCRPAATHQDSMETYAVARGFRSTRWVQYLALKRKLWHPLQGGDRSGKGRPAWMRRDVFSLAPLDVDLPRGRQFVWRCREKNNNNLKPTAVVYRNEFAPPRWASRLPSPLNDHGNYRYLAPVLFRIIVFMRGFHFSSIFADYTLCVPSILSRVLSFQGSRHHIRYTPFHSVLHKFIYRKKKKMLRCFSRYPVGQLATRSAPVIRRFAAAGAAAAPATSAPFVSNPNPPRSASISAAAELASLGPKRKEKPDPKCTRHCNVALRLLTVADEQYRASGTAPQWLSSRRRDQLRQLKPPAPQETVEDDEPSAADPPTISLPHKLFNMLSTYVKYEIELESLLGASLLPQRLRAKQWEEYSSVYRLDPLERQYVLHLVCNAVEKREVPLIIATRLLRRRWPASIMDSTGSAHHRFIVKSCFSWIAEELQKDTLAPPDARIVLDNSAFALKSSGTALVGKLAMVSIRDIREKDSAEALISLMWSVNSAGVHAPDNFWRQIFLRLSELNRSQKGGSEDSSFEFEEGPLGFTGLSPVETKKQGKTKPPSTPQRASCAHVFSGLTTRQIYRILAVLKKERWSGEAGEMHEMADQALKNIVFEAEALTLTEEEIKTEVPKRVLIDRLRSVSNLSFQEFLTLLTIAGDLGVPFHISALRVSDILFVPLTRFLDHRQLLSLLVVVRQTRCYSPSLMSTMAQQLQHRGSSAPYALPLTKAYIRAVMKEKAVLVHPPVLEFVRFFLSMCKDITEKIRLSEIGSLAELVYSIYRCHASESPLSVQCCELIEHFCKQADRLLQLQLCSTAVPTKLLELTMVMEMRNNPKYPNTTALLQTRNAASACEDARLAEDVALLSCADEIAPTGEPDTAPDAANASSSMAKGISSDGTTRAESDLPALPRSALMVYSELLYFFEKMAVVKSDVTAQDMEKFKATMEQTGLYSIFLGAHLMQQAHLSTPASAKVSIKHALLNTLPAPIQRRVHRVILARIGTGKKSAKPSTDDELLHILGQFHCSPEKVGKLLDMVQSSPLTLTRQQRDLWIFLHKVAERFGEKKHQETAQKMLQVALY
eukprot:gene3656-2590_t